VVANLDIRGWLDQLGLVRYADLFEGQEIDLSILPELSEADLVELGLPLGPRRKIQKGVIALRGDAPAFTQGQPVTAHTVRIPGELPGESAERRHLTVMFADIVGSSAMSARLDPEELREIMRAFQDVCKIAVDYYQGYIARFMGDGVLAYFGFPLAHEDDPERSVRAGLKLIAMVADLDERLCAGKDVKLQVRVGISTGPVVVGDLIGDGASIERSVVGETPNIAAKIEAGAPPGSVAIGEDTRRLLGNLFETEELPSRMLEGFGKPVRLFRVISERKGVSRFQASRVGVKARFVGRRNELTVLQESWLSICSSNGRAVLVTGEAGVGKSRITEEFLSQIAISDPVILQFQCSTFHSNSAFHPIIERLTTMVGLSREETGATIRKQLDAQIRDAPRPREESLLLLASLLSVDIGETLPAHLADNPPLRLAAMQEMLVEQLLALTDDGPVVVVFEDAHWMDPTTLETVLQLTRASRRKRMMVLVTSRPDLSTEHFLRHEMQSINLVGLNRDETTELVKSMPQGRKIDQSALDAVLDRTDGIPLFIEELTKLFMERNEEANQSIPSTLVDSLTARLDRLGTSKEVAQIGATIGREFPLELLCRVDGRDREQILFDIERLIKAELIQEVEAASAPVYRFKHALVQDAAYGTLLFSNRMKHHGRIADTLLEIFPESAENEPEIIAHHLHESGRIQESVDYWNAAGLKATNRSANAEAVHHLTRGIEALGKINPTTPALLKKELGLHIALGPPLVAARGYASDELESCYSRAMEIGEVLEEGITDTRALWGLGSFYLIRGRLKQSKDLQFKCLELSERNNDPDAQLLAHSWLGSAQFYLNEMDEARQSLQRAIDMYGSGASEGLAYRFGLDPAVLARVHLVWLYWLRGETDKAQQLDASTLLFAESLNHPLSHVHALNFSTVLQAFMGRYEVAHARAEDVLSVSGKFEFPHYLAYARVMKGYASSKLGSVNEGIDDMVNGLRARRDTGAELVRPMFLTMLAEVLADSDQPDWCLGVLDEADAIVSKNAETWLVTEQYRVRGLILDRLDPGQEQALRWLQKAIDLAADTASSSLEVRALESLVQVLKRCENRESLLQRALERLEALDLKFRNHCV
jgi:class 3 adenylate cyclase/tetratricopeptide (TPR) repeat protein